jgi:hypothetical protein
MKLVAPAAAVLALAVFASSAQAQDDPLEKVLKNLEKKVQQLEKKVEDLGKKLEKQKWDFRDFNFGEMMQKIDELMEDLGLDEFFQQFQGFEVPDLNELFERLQERFQDQFGDGFDLEDMLEQFRDNFGGFDLERMMEELRKMLEGDEVVVR